MTSYDNVKGEMGRRFTLPAHTRSVEMIEKGLDSNVACAELHSVNCALEFFCMGASYVDDGVTS